MINGPFIIRKLNENDFNDDSYYKLLSQLSIININEMNREKSLEIIKNLNDNHHIIVIENEVTREIIASGTLLIEQKILRNYGKVGHIEDIVVREEFRNRGVGKKMVEYLTQLSEKLGCYKTTLDCSSEKSEFYKKCGYKVNGTQMAKYV